MLDLEALIQRESGTGKEVVARALHRRSARALRPFVAVRCSALGEGMPQLFDQAGASLAESASGGILFLDEVEVLPAPLQARLLAFIEARDLPNRDGPTPARVIAASRTALDEAVRSGSLREDLFYRLSVLRLRMPPLRERREDIPPLFARFVQEALEQTRRTRFDMSAADRRRLLEYDWPGNARNYAFGAVLDLPRDRSGAASAARPALADRVAAFERALIVEALEADSGSVSRACTALAVSRQTLYEKVAKYGIDLARLRNRD